MDTKDEIEVPPEPKQSTYKLYHRKYYIKTRKFREQIMRWLNKFEVPLSVYEDYVDDDMGFVDLESAYLAIGNYVNLIKIQNIIKRTEEQINIENQI